MLKVRNCILILISLTISHFSFSKNYLDTTKKNDSTWVIDSLNKDSVIKIAFQYLKKPYCYGSKAPNCFDCSGFVQYCFQKLNYTLPRSSEQIAFKGKFVNFQNAKAGDLIFFTGRNSQSENVGHVGIVTKNENGKIFFIHASVQAGVIESHLEEDYYKKRILFIKRIKTT